MLVLQAPTFLKNRAAQSNLSILTWSMIHSRQAWDVQRMSRISADLSITGAEIAIGSVSTIVAEPPVSSFRYL